MRHGFQKLVTTAAAIAVMAGMTVFAGDAIRIRANVPFDFTIGERTVPAGEYYFARGMYPGSMKIESTDLKTTLFAVYGNGGTNKTGSDNALIFHRYDDRYFLREVQGWEGQFNAKFGPTRAEKEQMARSAVKGTVTRVAAR